MRQPQIYRGPRPKDPSKGPLWIGAVIIVLTLYWFYPATKRPTHNVPSHLTLVTHVSSDKLQLLQSIRSVWPGPLAVAIYGEEEEINLPSVDVVWVAPDPKKKYPVNTLRNMAVDLVRTDMYLMIDADVLPSADLFVWVQMNILYLTRNAPHSIFILPSFETDEKNSPAMSIYTLMTCIQVERCRQFRVKDCETCHGDSNYTTWLQAKEPYALQTNTQPIYQPYLIVRTSCAPPFPPEFDDIGSNDVVAWIHHLRHFGATFTVLPPPAFVLHRNHAPNEWHGNGHIIGEFERVQQVHRASFGLSQFLGKLHSQPGARLGCYSNRQPRANENH